MLLLVCIVKLTKGRLQIVCFATDYIRSFVGEEGGRKGERSAESRFQKKCGKNMRHMLHGQAQASHCSKGVCVCVSKFTVTG